MQVLAAMVFIGSSMMVAPLWAQTPGTWSKGTPFPEPSAELVGASTNGKFYAFGGFVPPESWPQAWVPINNAWEYDPATDRWKALAPMPSKRGSAIAAAVNGKIY